MVQEAVPLCLPLGGGEGGVKFGWMAFWLEPEFVDLVHLRCWLPGTWRSHLGEAYVTAAEVDEGGGPVLRFLLDRVICVKAENNHYRLKCKDFSSLCPPTSERAFFLSFFL